MAGHKTLPSIVLLAILLSLAWNDRRGPQTIRLFNLAEDSGEWKDRSVAKPERAQILQDLFDARDSRLPANVSGRRFSNRNAGFAVGARVRVAESNDRVGAP